MPNMLVTRTWPILVDKIENVPLAFQKYFHCYSQGEFPYVIFHPAERTFSIKRHAKVISVLEDEIRIYEKEKKQIKETCIKVKDVQYIEWGSILLNSWITVSFSAKGQEASCTLTYNSTSDPLYKHVIETLRNCTKEGVPAATYEAEEEKFGFLVEQDFKFMNLGKRSLQPGEEARQILYQPEMKEQYLKLFGKPYYKSLLKTSLVILTDSELILIREPEGTRVKHGGVRWFIPLNQIKQINATVAADMKKCILDIAFSEEKSLRLELEDSKLEDMKVLIDNIRAEANSTELDAHLL